MVAAQYSTANIVNIDDGSIYSYFGFFYLCSKKTAQLIHSKRDTISSDLVASWTVHVGDMDQVLHLWRYTGGFAKIDKAQALLENDAVSVVST